MENNPLVRMKNSEEPPRKILKVSTFFPKNFVLYSRRIEFNPFMKGDL